MSRAQLGALANAIWVVPLAVLMLCLVVRAGCGVFAGATIAPEGKKGARV